MTTAAKPDLRGKLEEVQQQIGTVEQTAQAKWQAFGQARDEFAAAGNEANRTDSDEFQKMDDVHKEFSTVSSELKQLEQVRDGIFAAMSGDEPTVNPEKANEPRREDTKSLAERAVSSDGYKALKESGALASDSRGFSAHLATMSAAELKTLLTGASDTSGGSFVANDVKPFVPQPRRPRRVLDLITMGSTTSDTVEYVRQSAFTNIAAETAEATTTDTGTKPEATIAFAKVTEAVKTIAHWIPATRRALADAGQLRTLVESQLLYGLEFRLEAEVVNGNGSGENLTGILQTSNILSQAKGSDSVSDAVHKAITQIRLGYIEPNGIALHPTDWEVVRLSRDDSGAGAGTGGYLYGPPSTAGAEQMWGLPVAVTPSVPDDTGIVADFRYSTLWLREGAQVLASDSHASFFIQNLVALLAELRAAFGVQLPASICKVTSVD